MKAIVPVPVLASLLLVLSGLALIPALQPYVAFLVGGAAVVALVLLLQSLGCCAQSQESLASKSSDVAKPDPVAQAPRAEAEVVSLLAALQEKGRLVDFLMDDITAFEDAQVGAAARVVHQGCRAVLQEHFDVKPVRDDAEGSRVTVPNDHAADEYRLTGNLSGQTPFSGTLVHKGWRTASVKLPRIIDSAGDRLPSIAPAEVEVEVR